MKTTDDLRRELEETQQWLLDHAAYVFEGQDHLREMTIARAYWHLGKWMALRDALGARGH
jgi:hypothetical protein